MKKIFLNPLISIILVLQFSSCSTNGTIPTTNNSSTNTNSSCNSTDFNNKFAQINGTLNYNQIRSIFGTDGDNFRNDQSGTSIIRYYKWYPCSDHYYYVQCWLKDDKLILADKTFMNNSCSNNISNQSFSQLSNGMTYNQVKTILNDDGDNFRNDYQDLTTTETVKMYKFYDCNDKTKNIMVWFYTGTGAGLINKNF